MIAFPSSPATALLMTTLLLAASPAAAQKMTNEGFPPSDPIMEEAEQDAPRNEFFLNSEQDVELIRFKRSHDIELCSAKPDRYEIGAARRGYALAVTWDKDSGVILPGNCLTFDAMRVTVKPAGPLPQSIDLVGTVKILR